MVLGRIFVRKQDTERNKALRRAMPSGRSLPSAPRGKVLEALRGRRFSRWVSKAVFGQLNERKIISLENRDVFLLNFR